MKKICYRLLSAASMLLLASCATMQNSSDLIGSPNASAARISYKNVTLTRLDLNQSGHQAVVKPGSTVHATVHYNYQCAQCYKTLNNQIIVGLAHRSAQACIYDGGSQGQGVSAFNLKAPAKPGKYEVRFRGLQAPDCAAALKAGWRADDSPTKATTIGIIVVSRKA